MCTCSHSEANALDNATIADLSGCWLFLWSKVGPCLDCSKRIIGRRISTIVYLDDVKDYHIGTKKLLEWAKIELRPVKEEWILKD